MKSLILFIIFSANAVAADLTIEQYIVQVHSGNDNYKASKEAAAGALLYSEEGSLPLTPILSGYAQAASDARQTTAPAFQGSKTTNNQYSLTLSQATRFGAKFGVSYLVSDTEIQGANPTFLPQSRFFDTKPMIEVTQSLGRNGFGSEISASEEFTENVALSTHHQERYNLEAKDIEAESVYLRLAFARHIVQVQRDSLDRGTKLRDWSRGRAQSALGDRADLLQSEAALQLRELDLQTAKDEEETASRSFNALRGIDSDRVDEKLVTPRLEVTKSMKKTLKSALRQDVQAAVFSLKAAESSAILGKERAKPLIDLYGNYSYNGREGSLSDANKTAWDGDHPMWAAGIRFTTSLNFGMAADVREGYTRARQAAELNLSRKRFEEQQQYRDLTKRLNDSMRRLQLTSILEEAQKQKMDYERNRLHRGRSTTFQVLMFEQDFATAQLSRIRTQFEVENLATQFKLYGGGQ